MEIRDIDGEKLRCQEFVNFSKDARMKLERVTKIQIPCSAVRLTFLFLSNGETS